MSALLRFVPTSVAIAVAASFCAAPALANDDIETIVVTGSRFEQNIDDQLMLIDTIDRQEIDRIAPKSVADLLMSVPSINVVNAGGAGQITSVSIRGANTSHTLVIIDGVRIGSATTGGADLSSLPPEQVERVEVLRGPRAAMWGSDAIGGVIQIFTRKLESGEWYATGEAGSNAYGRLSAGVGISHGDGNTTLSVNGEQSDGFDAKNDGETDDDGYERVSIGLNGEQELNNQWRLSWVGQLTDGEYDYDSNYDPGANSAEYLNYHYQLGAHFDNDLLQSSITLSQMQDDNKTLLDGKKSGNFVTNRDQLSWLGKVNLEALTVSTGFDWGQEKVDGTAYGKDSRNIFGLFTALQYQTDRLITEAVVRVDEISSVDSEATYNLSAGYQLTPELRLSASHGTAFKVPTFNDLYYPGSGNPDLHSETSETSEVTLNYQRGNWSAFVSAYKTDVENLIDWQATDELDDWGWPIYKPFNVNEATLQGVETGIGWQQGGWQTELNYSYLDAVDDATDKQLDNRSEHSANFLLNYAWDNADLGLEYNYRGETTDGSNELDAYHIVNLSVGYDVSENWKLRIKANNLLDEEVVNNAGYFGPGTEVYVSVSYLGF
ncbi:TonB-dependent receptor domain-containing protein [Ferrimonas aestuarii]|uniref:TonB-dependent receptor n=1 Tax=Ferrimonas aestuarii TaxID=2569539 RepID=A0A4U1BJR0_9GAMM|nr:TonB-dependent receptor [Ferrimonas aestuarii]TKB51670.1 TonB-dependent receptor [Ferrimonas aestuarii]